MVTLCFKGLVCLVSIVWMSKVFAVDQTQMGQEYQIYKTKIQNKIKELKQEEHQALSELKKGKLKKLSELESQLKSDLDAIDLDYEKRIQSLKMNMMQKTEELQKKTELSYIYSVKLQQEKFNQKKPVLVKYNQTKFEIEKEFYKKLQEYKVHALEKKYELLNDEKPEFLIELEDIHSKDWVKTKFCKVEKNYKFQDLWLTYLYAQYDKITPLNIELLELGYKEDIVKQSLEAYQLSFNKLEVLSEGMADKPKSLAFLSDKIMEYNQKLEATSTHYEQKKNQIAIFKNKLKKNFELAKKQISCELDKSKFVISDDWKSDKLVSYSSF